MLRCTDAKEVAVAEAPVALVQDLVTMVAPRPQPYDLVMEAWRTNCPRLTVWEDAVERGFVSREGVSLPSTMVHVTHEGQAFLAAHGRV